MLWELKSLFVFSAMENQEFGIGVSNRGSDDREIW